MSHDPVAGEEAEMEEAEMEQAEIKMEKEEGEEENETLEQEEMTEVPITPSIPADAVYDPPTSENHPGDLESTDKQEESHDLRKAEVSRSMSGAEESRSEMTNADKETGNETVQNGEMEAIDLESSPAEVMDAPKTADESVGDQSISGKENEGTRVSETQVREFVELLKPFLAKILKQTSGKKYTDMRHKTREALQLLGGLNTENYAKAMSTIRECLTMGCSTGKAVGEISVDCFQKLLEARNLGDGTDSDRLYVDDGRREYFEAMIIATCAASKLRDENISLRVIRSLLLAVEGTAMGVHQKPLLQVVLTMYNIYGNSTQASLKQASRQGLEKVTNAVFQKMEDESLQEEEQQMALHRSKKGSKTTDDENLSAVQSSPPVESISLKDSYFVFKGLCNLAAKELPDTSSTDTRAIKCKVLALDLVKSVLESSGPKFRTSPKFIHGMRSYLAPAILSNTMSDSSSVVDIALEIFEMMVVRKTFRAVMKKEIADIFQSVIFRFLDSPTAGFVRKRAALQVLSTICSDPQTITDLFLNYDCDMDSTHVFERMINSLCSAAQDGVTGPMNSPDEGLAGSEAGELRTEALNALVLALKSMRAWCSTLEVGEGDPEEGGDKVETISRDGTGNEKLSSVSAGDDDTARFQETLRMKKILEEGIQRFNTKAKAGLAYLSSHGYMTDTPEAIAQFLKETRGLDATVVGEYLGEGDDLKVNVMRIYTQSFSFAGMTFEEAIRVFLSAFRLPGEAQKIQRIMEEFAAQYHEGNPDVFRNDDTAFVLAYSTIMLNTDAHNPQVKKKMSKEEFIRNNKGIDDGKDLDTDFLEDIYDRIQRNEIMLSGDVKDKASDAVNGGVDGTDKLSRQTLQQMDARQRTEVFKKESEKVLAQAKSQFQRRRKEGVGAVPYYQTATSVHIVRLMLENIWCPILAAISILLERAGPADLKIVDLCLEGFRNAIALVSIFSMDMEKDAFVSSLSKFTLLNSITEMQKKSVECIRMLLVIAASEGSTLGSQWTWMIKAIVQLEQMRAVAAGTPNKYKIASRTTPPGDNLSTSGRAVRENGANGAPVVDANAILVANAIKDSEVEQIFSNSAGMTFAGFHDICSALTRTSTEELNDTVPVTYCLQKLVEVVLFNVQIRTNSQWTKTWELLSPFFSTILGNRDRDVCLFAIDCLKQLTWKFLEADETRSITYQYQIMKPLETCFSRSSSPAVKETILNCLSQMALARAANLKGGWKAIFAVLAMSADSRSEEIMNYGFQIADTIIRKYLGVVDDMFVPAIAGIGTFTRTPLSSSVALAALDHLSIRFVSLLAEGRTFAAAKPIQTEEGEKLFSESVDAHIQTWFPILIGISSGITSSFSGVRAVATEALFRVLAENGKYLSEGLWKLIYRGVLAPIFDDVRHLSESGINGSNTWAMSTGASVMRQLISVVLMNERTRHLLPDVLTLLSGWVSQSSEVVAREGVAVFTFLLTDGGPRFSGDDWQRIMSSFEAFFEETMPVEIMGPAQVQDVSELEKSTQGEIQKMKNAVVDFKVVRSKCVVQLLLAQSVLDTVVMNYDVLKSNQVLQLAGFLLKSYVFARDFNANSELRFALWRAGFMTQVPNLLKQETTCVQAYLQILFWLCWDDLEENDDAQKPKDLLFDCCQSFLSKYIDICSAPRSKSGRDDSRELGARTSIAIFIMENFLHANESFFRSILQMFFPSLVTLLRISESRELRDAISDIMEKRVSSVLMPDEHEPFTPSPKRPNDYRTLVFSLKDHQASAEAVAKHLEENDGVFSVELSEDNTQIFVQGVLSVQQALQQLRKESPGSSFISGGSMPFRLAKVQTKGVSGSS